MKNQLSNLKDTVLSSYLSKVSKIKMLTEEEEKNLSLKWKEESNQQAAQLLMVSHLPLVVKIAYGYKNYGQPVIDLISEGNIGLMKAIYKYDPYKGFRLATYAMWWIKAYITEYILNSWSVVKSGSIAGRKKLFFSLRRLKQKLGIHTQAISEANTEKISSMLNVSKEDVKYVNAMLENKDMSLEAPIYNSEGSSVVYGELLPDSNYNPEEMFTIKEHSSNTKAAANKAMQVLNTRERFIIEQRFLTENPRSLSDIGKELNLSRERIRQIEQKALQKAKNLLQARS